MDLLMRRPAGHYRAWARFYDVISAEWPVYRAGRIAAIDLLALQPGHHVLDIGCGTGIESPLTDVRAASVRGGRIQIRVGSMPDGGPQLRLPSSGVAPAQHPHHP